MKKKKIKNPPVDHKRFVVRQSGSPSAPDYYWFDGGQGFTKSLNEATRFTEDDGIHKLGELLHELKTTCELVDLGVPYVSPVKVGTAVLNNGKGVVELITSVPQIRGGSLTLISHTGSDEMKIHDFLDALNENDLEILWDPERSLVPESNDDYLEAHGFIKPNGVVEE